MSSAENSPESPALGEKPHAAATPYVVVARRYRPQAFADLVGQPHITQALSNAIASNRVGHAYLFTGARGTGKTSTARIFAKCLCCRTGPTDRPCNECEICQSISRGDDIDVLEIDGASNRGIDEIRQLRSNVSIRPSRARAKIYIIDEVHMLTKEAFNALLKTLEEPPTHVKFIFCTTDPEKMPITVLSRCQRFDFAPVEQQAIVARLEQIVASEGRQAERDALEQIARRAAGSMRDSQSLLEQLLAFGGETISLADVHRMLGTAGAKRVAGLVEHLLERNAAGALAELDSTLAEGVDPGQLTEQLVGYFRDLMAAAVNADPSLFWHVPAGEAAALKEKAQVLGLETILAMLQILDQALVRMKNSVHPRLLAEIALVRIASLENLSDLSALIAQVSSGVQVAAPLAPARGGPSAPAARPATSAAPPASSTAPPPASSSAQKKSDVSAAPPSEEISPPPSVAPADDRRAAPIASSDVMAQWQQVVGLLEDMTADFARKASRAAILAPNRLVVSIPDRYTKSMLEQPQRRQRIEELFAEVSGERYGLSIELVDAPPAAAAAPAAPQVTPRQRQQQAAGHPMVRLAADVFQAEILRTDPPRVKASATPAESPAE